MKMKKKIFSIVLFFVLAAGVLGGCGNSAKTQELSGNIDEYEKIAEVALNDFQDEEHRYKYDDCGDREFWIVHLSEFDKYEELKEEIQIAEKDFSLLWIEDGNVVFWNDETKVLGLLYSENAKKYIESLKAWYDSEMDYEKINDNWYTVGSWKHI